MASTHDDPSLASLDRSDPRLRAFYLAAWRWHFYAGLYVVPFLLILAISGLGMLWTNTIDGRDGERIEVTVRGTPTAVSAQADAALASVQGGTLVQYIAPLADDRAAAFGIELGDDVRVVTVDPYTDETLGETSRDGGLYGFFDRVHGTLLLGTLGDRLIETAASLAVVLVATGLYLWWPRDRRIAAALVPDLAARGRPLWKSLHVSVGAWVSLLLVVFLVSGLSWAGIWGGKFVQAWNTFPAEKFAAPLSDETHASMNHDGRKEVPWPLEQTPMPASGSDAGASGPSAATPVTIDGVAALARRLGFDARFQLALPDGDTGVWTISRDSMSSDSRQATTDRTVHVDRYTGKVLADVRFADYSIYGQAMAAGLGFHMGTLGTWNLALNTVFCAAVIFLCASGTVMWWKRRPARAGRLVAPPAPRDMPAWQGAVLVGLAVSVAFPLAGIALLTVLVLDRLLLPRMPRVRRLLT